MASVTITAMVHVTDFRDDKEICLTLSDRPDGLDIKPVRDYRQMPDGTYFVILKAGLTEKVAYKDLDSLYKRIRNRKGFITSPKIKKPYTYAKWKELYFAEGIKEKVMF